MAASTILNLWKKQIYYIHFTDKGYNSYDKYMGDIGDIQPDNSNNWPFSYNKGGMAASFGANYPGNMYMLFDNPSQIKSEIVITYSTIDINGNSTTVSITYNPALQAFSKYGYPVDLGPFVDRLATMSVNENTANHSFTLLCKG